MKCWPGNQATNCLDCNLSCWVVTGQVPQIIMTIWRPSIWIWICRVGFLRSLKMIMTDFCAILFKLEICVNVQPGFLMPSVLGQRHPLRIPYVELLFLMKIKGFRWISFAFPEKGEGGTQGLMNHKDTKPYTSFLLVFNRVRRRRRQSVMLVFSTGFV